MRYREPFKVFPKKLTSGNIVFYYVTYDVFNKRRQFSTGCSKKSEAKKFCYDLFKKDSLVSSKKLTFFEYTKNWYDYEKCPYITSIRAKGKKYSHSNADAKRSILIKRINPYIQNLYFSEIKSIHIEQWLIELKKQNIKNSTINHYLTTLKVIFNYAFLIGDIAKNPTISVKPLVSDTQSKSTLTQDEVSNLFNDQNEKIIWPQEVYRLMNLVSSQTGMRLGEIQALKKENLYKDHILVKYSWNKKYGLQSTKNGKERLIPISTDLFNQLIVYDSKFNNNTTFIFSDNNPEIPKYARTLYDWTYKAFKSIGISEVERKERNITFHSWRHYYNTQLIKKGIPLPIIQAIIGHSKDGKMTEHYTKLSKEDLAVVLD